MDRIYESGAVETPPPAPESPSAGYPSARNPAAATPATKPGPYWYHMITESMRRVIVAAGLAPNHANLDRFKDAIVALAAAALTAATEAVAGVLRIATQAETNAGTADDRIVTPKKLKFGFLASLATNGYVVFPSWLGGLIIQWGSVTISTTTTINTATVTFPVAFPNSCLLFTGGRRSGLGTANNPSYGITHIISSSSQGTVYSVTSTGSSSQDISWLAIGY